MVRAGDVEQKLDPAVLAVLGDVTGRRILYAGDRPGRVGLLLTTRGADVILLAPSGVPVADGAPVIRAGLGEVQFQPVYDAVLADLVLGTVEDWKTALRTAVRALKPGGQLVFSVEHPLDFTGGWDEYDEVRPDGDGFHRPFSTYLNAVIAAGCRIDAVAEPGFLVVSAYRTDRKV
ncbi:MAG TPA: methyltransferase domain-containing protein [Kribbellaceae bacterium]|jgi:SAM-dependent methyltransferase